MRLETSPLTWEQEKLCQLHSDTPIFFVSGIRPQCLQQLIRLKGHHCNLVVIAVHCNLSVLELIVAVSFGGLS